MIGDGVWLAVVDLAIISLISPTVSDACFILNLDHAGLRILVVLEFHWVIIAETEFNAERLEFSPVPTVPMDAAKAWKGQLLQIA